MSLTGRQSEQMTDAIRHAFTLLQLRQMLRFDFDMDLADVSSASNYQEVVFELVETASRDEWASRLLLAARKRKPRSQQLLALAVELGVETATAAATRPGPTGFATAASLHAAKEATIRASNVDPARPGIAQQGRAAADLPVQAVTSLRFERAIRDSLGLVWRLADMQDLYTQLSKMTEQLLYYRTYLASQEPQQEQKWQIISYGLETISGSVIAIGRDYRVLLDGRAALAVGDRLTTLSRRMSEAREVQVGAVGDLEQHLETMRTTTLRMQGYVKRQLELKLEAASGASILVRGRLLLRIWERAFRQYQLWDNCAQFVLGIQNKDDAGYWDIVYERTERASEASEDLLETIEHADLGDALDNETDQLRAAIGPVPDLVENASGEQIGPTVRAAKDAARMLAEAVGTTIKDWIGGLVEGPLRPVGTQGA
jgi:hypothetical protein